MQRLLVCQGDLGATNLVIGTTQGKSESDQERAVSNAAHKRKET